MNKQRAIMLGITSGAVIVGGIIMSVLLYQAIVTLAAGHVQQTTESNLKAASVPEKSWSIGLVYIVPGLLGLIAAFLQNKCMYVLTCIFTMISILIMGLIAIIAGLAFIVLIFNVGTISKNCIDADGLCKCRDYSEMAMDEYQDSPFKTCAYFETFIALVTAVLFFVVLSWVAAVIEFVCACFFACRSQTTTMGVVIASDQRPGPDATPYGYGQQPLLSNKTPYGPDQGYPPPVKV